MFSSPKFFLALSLLCASPWVAAQATGDKYPGVGRAATPSEIAAWDIDVRPDFLGLPKGSGSVAQGQDIWEAKCASCHGIFGESNEVFSPLVGGTTADDVKTGHVKRLLDPAFPGRTTFMKVATLSTVWDFINRAMPWNAPKSLQPDEVYAVTAFLLNLGGIVPDDFVLTDKTMATAQARLPNRNGMTTRHALWPNRELGGLAKPDTANTLCMKNCDGEPKLASYLPDFARNAHGNLAEQNHIVGQQIGANTAQPEVKGKRVGALATAAVAAAPAVAQHPALVLMAKLGCVGCHSVDKKIVGPAFADVARKYPGQADYLAGKIRSGGSGLWGPIPMPPQDWPQADIKVLADWLAAGAGK
jgi:cytochrome c